MGKLGLLLEFLYFDMNDVMMSTQYAQKEKASNHTYRIVKQVFKQVVSTATLTLSEALNSLKMWCT